LHGEESGTSLNIHHRFRNRCSGDIADKVAPDYGPTLAEPASPGRSNGRSQ
jgi:hypothetical protein